jgi:hypothetical protein
MEEAARLGIPAASWLFLDSISAGNGHDVPERSKQMNFHIGDRVRLGTRVGIITDIGTVLVQVKTTEGRLRVACPWELVRTLNK